MEMCSTTLEKVVIRIAKNKEREAMTTERSPSILCDCLVIITAMNIDGMKRKKKFDAFDALMAALGQQCKRCLCKQNHI